MENNEFEEMEKPSYFAIIPAEIRYDKDLKDKAKLLYGEITCLSNKKGYCYASNDYFANLYGVAKETISRLITDLVDKGYVTREVIYKKGTKEIINRYIKISQYPLDKNVKTLLTKKSIPIDEKVKENNTSINNINKNNTRVNIKKVSKKEESFDDIIDNSVENEDVKKELYEFIKMRKLIKRPLTNRALEMIINKLNTLSKDEKEQIKILDQSIINNWQNIYPIKEDERKSTGNIFRDIGIEEGIF
jgi:DNA-binding transcriptional ArsR family regulator